MTTNTPSFREDHISQIPALQLLSNMGYIYLTPADAMDARGARSSQAVLDKVLDQQLRRINTIRYKGETYPFSNNNITAAIDTLRHLPFDGVVRSGETFYHHISLGRSFKETIRGDTRSFSLQYIDWEHIHNNVFHVTAEFEMDKENKESRGRLDIVLFVNGIPFAAIECKRPDQKDSLETGVRQLINYQKEGNIRRFFVHTQLLVATNKNQAVYATASSPAGQWFPWREEGLETAVKALINTPLPGPVKDRLFSKPFRYARDYFDGLEESPRLPTGQDRALYALCRPERLLELSRRYILFDKNEKKIARYQQYFAVKETLARLREPGPDGKRKGGVVFHSQGSGKSLSMVMTAKALAMEPHIPTPRILLVTDRINLDHQLAGTFKHCGLTPVTAKSGAQLMELLQNDKKSIITTVINKFQTAFNKKDFMLGSPDIFVLVDESHRSQYGKANAKMMRVLPNACYLGFTGTPLKKKEKNTALKFGGFIHTYTMDDALRDRVIVPLLYEGRHALQEVNRKPIDKWADRVCEPLTPYQESSLKKKFSHPQHVLSTEQRIREIAYDIRNHYKTHWQGTGFKAMLVAAKKADALKFKEALDELGGVTGEVLISGPAVKECPEDIYDSDQSRQAVETFWTAMMDRHGSEKEYNQTLRTAFRDAEEPEIIIVVHKLLTGYDAPRNTVMYICRKLYDHTLLQAIARVNRIFPGKDYGYIIDYEGILYNLDKALTRYRALRDFDQEDLKQTLISVYDKIKELPQKHSELWAIFKEVPNKRDEEAYERLLADEALRHRFHHTLSHYARLLEIALSTLHFFEKTPPERIAAYQDDLKFFTRLREAVKKRYAEFIDFKEYEVKFKKLLDTYVDTDEIIPVTAPVSIFNREEFKEEVRRVTGSAAKADTIAHRTARAIEEQFDRDPAYYQKYSKLLEETIENYRRRRTTEAEYLKESRRIMDAVSQRKGDRLPRSLQGRPAAAAYYGVSNDVLRDLVPDPPSLRRLSAKIGLAVDDIIRGHQVVDWHLKEDIRNTMCNDIEDFLYQLKDDGEVDLSYDHIDKIMDAVIGIARKRRLQ